MNSELEIQDAVYQNISTVQQVLFMCYLVISYQSPASHFLYWSINFCFSCLECPTVYSVYLLPVMLHFSLLCMVKQSLLISHTHTHAHTHMHARYICDNTVYLTSSTVNLYSFLKDDVNKYHLKSVNTEIAGAKPWIMNTKKQ